MTYPHMIYHDLSKMLGLPSNGCRSGKDIVCRWDKREMLMYGEALPSYVAMLFIVLYGGSTHKNMGQCQATHVLFWSVVAGLGSCPMKVDEFSVHIYLAHVERQKPRISNMSRTLKETYKPIRSSQGYVAMAGKHNNAL